MIQNLLMYNKSERGNQSSTTHEEEHYTSASSSQPHHPAVAVIPHIYHSRLSSSCLTFAVPRPHPWQSWVRSCTHSAICSHVCMSVCGYLDISSGLEQHMSRRRHIPAGMSPYIWSVFTCVCRQTSCTHSHGLAREFHTVERMLHICNTWACTVHLQPPAHVYPHPEDHVVHLFTYWMYHAPASVAHASGGVWVVATGGPLSFVGWAVAVIGRGWWQWSIVVIGIWWHWRHRPEVNVDVVCQDGQVAWHVSHVVVALLE